MARIPVAYIYQSLSVAASVAAARAQADLTRQMAAKYLIGCYYGGFHRDYHTHWQNKVPTLQRPKAKHLWRTCQPGDWLVMFSIPSMGWLNSQDYYQFVRMFLVLGVGIVSIKEGVVIPPHSQESRAFDQAYMLLRRVRRTARRRADDKGRSDTHDRVKIHGHWNGADLGAFELVSRLRGLGFNRVEISGFLSDMDYRPTAFLPMHVAVANMIREFEAPEGEDFTESFTIDGLQRSEVKLIEAAANVAGTTPALWAIDVLGRAAAKRVAKATQSSSTTTE